MNLTEAQRKEIEKAVDDLFFTLKAKILGRFFEGPRIYFEIVENSTQKETVEGIFRYTYQMLNPGKEPDKKQIKTLASITGNYIEAERAKTKAKVLADVQAAETQEDVSRAVKEHFDRATSYIDMLVNNEARVIQSYAEKSGIEEISASMGIEDPVVAKLGVIDSRMCKSCRKLWHTKENVNIPKVYKLSELQEGYNKDHRNPKPTVGPTHPRCRHVMTFVPPNFGFSRSGQIEFKGFGYDVYAHQHGLDKVAPTVPEPNAWDLEDLFKLAPEDHGDHVA